MIDRIGALSAANTAAKTNSPAPNGAASFGDILRDAANNQTVSQPTNQAVNFSKHALSRVEERGIELTPDLMDKLAGSVEKAQEKGAVNILAFGAEQAFIINVPHSRVITTITQDEMKEKIFTNIDAAILL